MARRWLARLRPELAPDGTRILRHELARETPFGLSDEHLLAEREGAYDAWFGEFEGVNHEVVPLVPHVDVYVYAPSADRPYRTLVTGGMSDLRMRVPRGARGDPVRVELVLYVSELNDEHVGFLRLLAHIPHDLGTWFGAYHTLTNGDPPTPFFSGSRLDSVILLPPPFEPEARAAEHLKLGGDPVALLWPVPITASEAAYKLEHGADAFESILAEHGLPVILDEARRPVA